MKPKLVVIGNGMAGMRTVEELLQSAPDAFQITVFGAEPYGNYNRIMLSSVLSGEKAIEEIVINDRQWYLDHAITLHAGPEKEVVRIERGLRRVIARDGTIAEYDRLLIATGSKPVVPDIPGTALDGVISFRDIFDVNTMLQYCQTHKTAVVLGGGLLGLEAANGLAMRGMEVTVIHSKHVLLNRQMDCHAGEMLRAELQRRGLKFHMSAQIKELIDDGNGHVRAVRIGDDRELPCDLFILAIGVRPNIALAQKAGLYCERGIVVNDTLQTYDPSVYAVGECIQHRGATFGLVAPLFEQAKVCANHLSQHGVGQYMTLTTATKLKVTGIQLFSIGQIDADQNSSEIRYTDAQSGIYRKLVVGNDDRLLGAVLYGDTGDGIWYQQLIEERQPITAFRESVVFGRSG